MSGVDALVSFGRRRRRFRRSCPVTVGKPPRTTNRLSRIFVTRERYTHRYRKAYCVPRLYARYDNYKPRERRRPEGIASDHRPTDAMTRTLSQDVRAVIYYRVTTDLWCLSGSIAGGRARRTDGKKIKGTEHACNV
jgi:hypothetical protein